MIGSTAALRKFTGLLRAYCSNPDNARISEHEHYGPYFYLEVGTWTKTEITDHWIAGPLPDLRALADEIDGRLDAARPGDILAFRDVFAPDAPYALDLEVRGEPFDPASLDENAR